MPCRAPRDDGLFRCSVMLAGSDTEWGKPTQVLLLRTSAPLQRRKPRCRIHCRRRAWREPWRERGASAFEPRMRIR